jgi:O-antigen ligase
MPEHLRALVVILAASVAGFYLITGAVRRHGFGTDLRIWKKSWFLVTICAFLAHNMYIFYGLLALYVIVAIPKDPSIRLPLYVLLALMLPNISLKIPGFGLVNYLIDLSYTQLLAILLLLPCITIRYVNGVRVPSWMSLKTDKYILLLVVIISILDFRDVSFTEGLRRSTYHLINVLLPYYVFSRYIKNEDDIKRVLFALLIPVLIMALMAIPEVVKEWHFYTALPKALGEGWGGQTSYKFRGGFLRAYGPYGAIPFGLLLTLAFASSLYLLPDKGKRDFILIGLLLMTGLLFTFSRGPWVSFVVMMFAYGLLARKIGKFIPVLLIVSVISAPLLVFTNTGRLIVNMLPIVGSEAEQTNITYRQNLLRISLEVANESPLFGDANFLENPKMQPLIQGEGIIDIVNTYLQYLLEYGYAGLCVFLMIFVSTLLGLWRVRSKLRGEKNKANINLLNIILGMWVASLTLIATVSSIGNGNISVIYWMLTGLSGALIAMIKNVAQNSTGTQAREL